MSAAACVAQGCPKAESRSPFPAAPRTWQGREREPPASWGDTRKEEFDRTGGMEGRPVPIRKGEGKILILTNF